MKVDWSHLCLLGGLIAASLAFNQALGVGASGTIIGFSLNSCGAKNCISIEAPRAQVGFFDGSYGFEKAKLIIVPVQRKDQKRVLQQTILQSNDLYYDFNSKKIFIRAIDGQPDTEAYYDLVSEELRSFPAIEVSPVGRVLELQKTILQ